MSNFHWRTATIAIVGFLAVVAILAAIFAATGAYDVAADAPHTAAMRDLIAYVRVRSIESRSRGIRVPPLNDRKMIADGASDYDAMCTGCHLGPGLAENEMRPGMNPKPPLLARGGFGTPAENFWVIKHGIKMTGMPAWGVTHSDSEIWNMVAFLQVLPGLSPAQYRALVAQSGGHHEHDHGDDDQHMNMPH
jgi:mono/diheme cytochrome c family protein